jgi:hypothetical protein
MVGATMIESEFAGPITARSLMELLNAAYALHPAFADAVVVETGAGIRPAFPDNFPRATRDGNVVSAQRPSTATASCWHRHGWKRRILIFSSNSPSPKFHRKECLMKLIVNGEPRKVTATTLSELLALMDTTADGWRQPSMGRSFTATTASATRSTTRPDRNPVTDAGRLTHAELYETEVTSRLLLGTARYPSPAILAEAVRQSATDIVTVSLRRETGGGRTGGAFLELIRALGVRVLPNTAGCHTVSEAVLTAKMAREVFATNWIKLEVIGNHDTLQPDVFGLVEAARILSAKASRSSPIPPTTSWWPSGCWKRAARC